MPSGLTGQLCAHAAALLLSLTLTTMLPSTTRCREMVRNSPTALRLLKTAMNAVEDGQAGLQMLGGDATMLFYNSEEGNEVWSLNPKP